MSNTTILSKKYSLEEEKELLLLKEEFCDVGNSLKLFQKISLDRKIGRFITNYFIKRAIPNFSLNKKYGIYSFGSVGTHVDRAYDEVLMFPLKGLGVLQHIVDNKVVEDNFCPVKKFPIIFQQLNPHSFITEEICFAILCRVNIKISKYLHKILSPPNKESDL